MLTLCLSLLLMITNSQITDKKEEVMKFELIQLPYATSYQQTNNRFPLRKTFIELCKYP